MDYQQYQYRTNLHDTLNIERGMSMKRSLSNGSYNSIQSPQPIPKHNNNTYIQSGLNNEIQKTTDYPHVAQSNTNFNNMYNIPTQSHNTSFYKKRKRARNDINNEYFDSEIEHNIDYSRNSAGLSPSANIVQECDKMDYDMNYYQTNEIPCAENINTRDMQLTPSSTYCQESEFNYLDQNSAEYVEDYMLEGYDLKTSRITNKNSGSTTSLKKTKMAIYNAHDQINCNYNGGDGDNEMQFQPQSPSSGNYKTVNHMYSTTLDDITGAQYSLYDDIEE